MTLNLPITNHDVLAKAVTLEPTPLNENVEQFAPIVAYKNKFISIQQVPSRYGPYNTLVAGETNKGVAVLVYKDGQIALIQQARYAAGVNTWELPRGGVDVSETFAVAAAREVSEEINIKVDVSQLVNLGPIHPDSGLLSTAVEIFFVDLTGTDAEASADMVEVDAVQFVDVDVVETALIKGYIYDSFTATAFLRAKGQGLFS